MFLPVSYAVGWSTAYWQYISDVGLDNVTSIGEDEVPAVPALFDDGLNDTWVLDVMKTLDLELPESEKNVTLSLFWDDEVPHLRRPIVLMAIGFVGLGKCFLYL